MWASCRALSGYEGEARDKFLETIAWFRGSALALFREYDGRSSLKTFAALVVRDFHCRKIVGLFERDAAKAWRMLQDFLEADIRRLIRRRAPAPELDETPGIYIRASVSRWWGNRITAAYAHGAGAAAFPVLSSVAWTTSCATKSEATSCRDAGFRQESTGSETSNENCSR